MKLIRKRLSLSLAVTYAVFRLNDQTVLTR